MYRLSDGSIVTCFIHDIFGNEKTMNEKEIDNYYKIADGCLIVYDISKKQSFEEVKKKYIPIINQKCKKNIRIILLGNKSDLDYLREVSIDEGTNLALDNNFYFKEISCVENKNVDDVFQTMIEMTHFELNELLKKSKCSIF